MIIDIHVLQNLAPSNINRDDSGAPKEAMFGGHRRARVSSQSWKRAVREAFREQNLVPEEQRAIRSRRLMEKMQTAFEAGGKDPELSLHVARTLLAGLKFAPDSRVETRTQYLLFLGNQEVEGLINVALENWDELSAVINKAAVGTKKKELKAAVPEDVQKKTLDVLNGGRAVDLALFGRMLADLPDKNVDGATQVAHAISTHAIEVEWDFYTAVDDLNLKEDTGAGMMGTVDFDSSTLYRYANVDMKQLTTNLGGDSELASSALEAFLRGFLTSIPTGKQNSFAAQNKPAFALAIVRDSDRWSLANAFVNPVPTGDEDILATSISRLVNHWKDMEEMYQPEDLQGKFAVVLNEYSSALDGSGFNTVASIGEWIASIVESQGSNHGQ